MKITLDHNCLIHLERGGTIAGFVRALIDDPSHQCFVVNVGASEMLSFGVKPDNYHAFEVFLEKLGVASLHRLDPIGVWDVTFWDHCLYCGDADQALFDRIHAVLFPTNPQPDDKRKGLNQLCDTLTMWCHISYKNEVFLTTDDNFTKATKLPNLTALGAGRICAPGQV